MAELLSKPPPLSDAERAALCQAVDFLAVLAADGVAVEKSGKAWRGSVRREENPSCYFYPPNVGKRGNQGWTWKDFGGGGGDALGYLLDIRGMEWRAAVRYLAKMAGLVPECVKTWDELDRLEGKTPQDAPGSVPGGRPIPEVPPELPPVLEVPKMPLDAQAEACAVFLSALVDLHPEAAKLGDAYLVRRGVLPRGLMPCAYDLPANKVGRLLDKVAHGSAKDLLLQAGLLRPPEQGKPLRLFCWGPCCLMAHHDAAGRPMSFIARRLDFKPGATFGKYLQQGYEDGGATRHPFGLPMLYRPPGLLEWKPDADKEDVVLVVEGSMDALAAACLGWPAVGLSKILEARSWKDGTGADAMMLEPHLPKLRTLRHVYVMPDNDPGDAGAEHEAVAARLVGWLRSAGCAQAEVATMKDLCPEDTDCKDLGEVAAKLKGCPP